MKISAFLAPACLLLGPALPAQTVTSVANGSWDAGTTWSDGLVPTAASTYEINGEVVNTPNLSGNGTRTFAGAGLTISSGRLDLKVEHNGSAAAANFYIPGLLLSGGTLRSDASTGNATLILQSPLTVSGTSSIEARDGSFTNSLSLSQGLSGSGLIQFSTDRSGNSGTGERAHLRVLGTANAYSGDWSVRGFDTTGEHANLWADAAGSLGTGRVELLENGRLVNQVTGGIDSLAGVTLTGSSALLSLVQPWANPNATLAVNHGRVDLGSATSGIGSLSGTGGLIQGTGASSSLTVNQTTDATFAGQLGQSAGASLAFTKNGNATLILSGASGHSGTTDVNAGTLRINGDSSAALGPATVGAAATLGGTGRYGGTISVDGRLAPGDSVESLATGSVTFHSGSVFSWEMADTTATGADLLAITGNLGLSGEVALQLIDSGHWNAGDKLSLISYTGTWNGGLFTLAGDLLEDDSLFTFNARDWLINYDDLSKGSNFSGEAAGRYVTLSMVPETDAALVGGVCVFGLLSYRRRKP